MAAALLGKCIGLLALVLVCYTCCYAFRIRDHGVQLASTEQPQRATCNPIFGRCQERTTASTSTSRKWHETNAAPSSRLASRRKPPVEVTSMVGDVNTDQREFTEHETIGHSLEQIVDDRLRVDDDDDDEMEVIVEVEEDSDDDEEEPDEDDDDDETVDDHETSEKERTVGQSDDESDEDLPKSKKDLKRKVEGIKLAARKNKITKVAKGTRKTVDEEDDDDDEEEVYDLRKRLALEEDSEEIELFKERESKSVKDEVDEEEDEDKDDEDEDDEDDEDEDEDEDEDDEDEEEEEEEDEDSKEVASTPPPRKLEKVRFADKDKAKSGETKPPAPILEKTKVEGKLPERAKKSVEITRKVVETTKKPVESSKRVESVKTTKLEPESSKPKLAPKPDEKIKGTVKPEDKSKVSVKLEDKSKVFVKPEDKSKVSVKLEDKSKVSVKLEDKSKTPVKPEVSKTPAQRTKEQPRQPEKPKVETKVTVKATPAKQAEVKRFDKEDSKAKTRTHVEATFTLAQLNDALLRVPTFVPNFTAVEDFECQQHGKIFLRQLRGYKLWALQMLDSSAKIPSGLLRGNVNQLGDFDECLGVMAHVKLNNNTLKVQGKYCLANIDLHASHPDTRLPVNMIQARAFIRGSMHDPGHFVPKFTTVNWALCLPAVCSAEDAENVLEQALNYYNSTIGIKFTVDVEPNMCYVKQKSGSYSKETIGVLYFYAMVGCLVLVATVRDYLVVSQGKGNYSERIIMSFSLRRTVRSLLKRGTSEIDIACIHGIRTLVTIVLYIAHQLIVISRLPFANRIDLTEVANNPLSSVLRVSMVYTDAFLLLSGVLTAYNMANEFTVRGEIRWFCRFIARYIRLTPALLAVVFWYAFVMEHTGSGPQWNSVIMPNAELCKNNAWTNLLYIQNFFPFEEMCATHTHQLALDMQLSLLAPMFVFFLECKPIIGILLLFFFVLLSATLRYIATMNNYLSLVIFHGMSLKHLYKTANLSYTLPLHRATPYVFGLGLGVLLHNTGRDVRIHKVLVILGWLIAMALGSWSLFSPWHLARRDYVYDAEEATNYAVICPLMWALALCWVIFACHTKNGGVINRFLSNHWLVIFSRITYAVYLTQFAVFFYNVGTTRYSSEFQLYRAIDLMEAATVVAVSIVLTLFFDLPMQEIKNVIMESTDTLTADVPSEEKSTDQVADEAQKSVEREQLREAVFEDDEVTSTGWDWQKDIVEGGVRSGNEIVEDEEQVNMPILKKSTGRRKSFMSRDSPELEPIPTWDWIKEPNKRFTKEDDEYRKRGRRGRNGQRDYREAGNEDTQQERDEAVKRSRRSSSRGLDGKRSSGREGQNEDEYSRSGREDEENPRRYRRSGSRGRSVIRESDDYRSWEFVGKERSSSRGPDSKRLSVKSEEHDPVQRQTRPPLTRSSDARGGYSSESEDEIQQRMKLEKRHPSVEPRISDEEDWETELGIRRKQFMEKFAAQQRDTLDELDDTVSTRRRSSAEGKIALLKDPSANDNMDSWTVSVGSRVAQLGSSQEPSEPEEDNAYTRRREYREQAPPPREDTQSEEDVIWDATRRRSYTSSSQVTSVEEDEDTASYNFVLTKESKRKSLQDLTKLSQEDVDLSDAGWNVVQTASGETLPRSTSLGLFKRESIVKSQASEEDPEYLLPERPKLVQQEREHPFKKAWQMQKSRSEEDGSAYAVKDVKELKTETRSRNDDAPEDSKRDSGGDHYEDVGVFADDESESVALSQSRSSDTEDNRTELKSEETESMSTGHSDTTSIEDNKTNPRSDVEEDSFNWPTEEEHVGVYKTSLRSKSEETDWTWEHEET
ncbi:uncharacterized protein LOC143154256 [Ptiloglossa arizonensis]|uniref:uncharacterized protein LOC143154256 n=1 Tax=Ptiloglossa arizonensis TaxID=3350558 RepID=UPI003F9F08E3